MMEQERMTMLEAANVIRQAMQSVGCHTPIRVVEYGKAVRVGTESDFLMVRFEDNLWKVHSHTPYLDCDREYTSLADCAHDIAMCDQSAIVFEQVEATEQRIDEAIEEALHH